jgi:hypothetical protein
MFDKRRFVSYKNTLNGDLISRKFPSDLHTPLTHSQFPLYNSHFKVKKLIATLADSLKHPIPYKNCYNKGGGAKKNTLSDPLSIIN